MVRRPVSCRCLLHSSSLFSLLSSLGRADKQQADRASRRGRGGRNRGRQTEENRASLPMPLPFLSMQGLGAHAKPRGLLPPTPRPVVPVQSPNLHAGRACTGRLAWSCPRRDDLPLTLAHPFCRLASGYMHGRTYLANQISSSLSMGCALNSTFAA